MDTLREREKQIAPLIARLKRAVAERNKLNEEFNKVVKQFQDDTGLGDHRVGLILASDGRMLDRIFSGGSVSYEIMMKAMQSIPEEMDKPRRRKWKV